MPAAEAMLHSSGLELPEETMQDLQAEAAVMIRMRHPNVVQASSGQEQLQQPLYFRLCQPYSAVNSTLATASFASCPAVPGAVPAAACSGD